jgi:hypothetical protein
MAPENVIIAPVPDTPEKANVQYVKGLENVYIAEVQEDWLQGCGLLNN